MKKIIFAVAMLIGSTTSARAEPISAIIALLTQISAAISAGVSALGVSVFGAGAWASISAFFASPFGALILGVGLSLVSSLFSPKAKKAQNAPTLEAGKVNVRITEPERWMVAGEVRQGGGVLFAEFDSNGDLWYLIVHSDSILTNNGSHIVYLDDYDVVLDGDGFVTSNQFCLDSDYNSYSGSGTKVPYIRMWTTTYSESDPTPPGITALIGAFPGVWTADHKLVGTTYSVVVIDTLPPEHRYKIYKWRGPLGMGEPAVSILGEWSKMYDPRDETQTLGDRSTYKYSTNPALIWAWFRTHKRGRNKPESSINWAAVAEQADICDQIVTGLGGSSQKRYECSIGVPESKMRSTAEQEILLSCDGQIVFDNDGKTWMRVGYYEAPTLTLSRNRDIAGMESVEAQTGENETQGVIVRYIDPEARYSTQPAAAWLNPLWYVPGEVPKFLSLDILACRNHNQAMRLAKAFGMRSQSTHKILPTVGLRGLKARQERIVNIQYDNTFSGDYEIVTNVEVDELGLFSGFGAVPVDVDRWTLLPGEEKPKPVISEVDSTVTIDLPTDFVLQFNQTRFDVTFDPPTRKDFRVRVQYKRTDDSEWSDMFVQSASGYGYSGSITANADYLVRYQMVTSSGKTSAWSSEIAINTSPLILGGTPVTNAEIDTAYTSWIISVSGGISPYTFEDVGNKLPPGITVNSSGNVSGTPTVAGNFVDITIKVSDAVGNFKYFPTFAIEVMLPPP